MPAEFQPAQPKDPSPATRISGQAPAEIPEWRAPRLTRIELKRTLFLPGSGTDGMVATTTSP